MKITRLYLLLIAAACLENSSLAASDSAVTFVQNALADPEAAGDAAVPEPSTYALLGMGALTILMMMRRKKTA